MSLVNSLWHVLIQISPFKGKGNKKEKTIKKGEMFKQKIPLSNCFKMWACSPSSVDFTGEGQNVFKEILLIGMSHHMICWADLIQGAAARKLILPDGVLNIYMHCLHGQMFSLHGRWVGAWTISCPTSELRDKRMPKLCRCLLSGIIQSCSIGLAQRTSALVPYYLTFVYLDS